MRFLASPDQLPIILNYLREQLHTTPEIDKEILEFTLATEEALANIIAYAYPKNVPGAVEITIDKQPSSYAVTLKDWGQPFNPNIAYHPPKNTSIEELPIGGLGMHLMHKCADEVEYKRVADANELTLRKYLPVTV